MDSSVYMCFPCYREFPTLEEVLTHQLTCTAESIQPLPTGTPVEAAAIAAGLPQLAQAESIPYVEGQVEASVAPVEEENQAVPASSDVPRVLYQCADCELLFDALSLWQQHRKMGCCQETGPGPGVAESTAGQEETMVAMMLPDQTVVCKSEEGGQEQLIYKQEDLEGVVTSAPENTGLSIRGVGESVAIEAFHLNIMGAHEPLAPVDSVPTQASDAAEPEEEQSPPVRRRSQKKAKPPSSLLCVECGQCFSLVSELVTHRRTAHGLMDALHRCAVCGEGFINTTLFLYHRKQHRAQVEEEEQQREVPPPVPQLSTALLEGPGEGLLLLATAGEGQSLLEIASLEQTVSESVPVAQVEVELEPETLRGEELQESGQELVSEEPESIQAGETVVEEIVNMDIERMDEGQGEGGIETEKMIVEEQQVEAAGDAVEDVQMDAETSAAAPGGRSFLCIECGSFFEAELPLAMHRSTEHGLTAALHVCNECGQEFMSTTLFLLHRREHRKNAPALSSPGTRQGLSPTASSPARHRDVILLRRPESVRAQTSSEPSSTTLPETNIEAPAKLSRDWSRTPLPHQCPHCGRSFTRRSLLREHVFHHTGEKLFNCHACKKSFPSPASLLRHSLTHGASRSFSCPICAKSFFQPTSLKRHMLTHEEGGVERRGRGRGKGRGRPFGEGYLHSCPECPASFKLESQLQTHRLLHTSHPFPCSVCGEAFKRRKELDLHSLMHQDKEPKSCPQCGSQFLNQAVLDIHLQRCTGEPPQRRRYKGHGRGRVGGQLECDMCGHRCVTQDGLDLHRLSHTGQTPLRCPLTPCRRRFASSSALAEHVLAHCRGALGKRSAPRRFACEFCGKEFAYASTFAVHMRTHTDERPFECGQCGKRFRQLPHLQDHQRIHSGERPFTCWVCGKSFSVAARLTEHARVHSGERPYSCPRCPTAFRSRPNLDKHMRLHADDPADPAGEAGVADEDSAVQTILLVQEADGSSPTGASAVLQDGAVMADGSSVVFLNNIGMPAVSSMAVPGISVVAGQEVPHTVEFIIEETV